MNKGKFFIRMATIGFLVTAVINIVMAFLISDMNEVFWTIWAPMYFIWSVFFIIGVAKNKNKAQGDEVDNEQQ